MIKKYAAICLTGILIMPALVWANMPPQTKGNTSPISVQEPTDIPLHPDQAMVNYLLQKGIVTLSADNLFHPQASISRGEYALWLFKASGIMAPFVCEFPFFKDVGPESPYYQAVESLRLRHVIHDTKAADGYFHPQDPIKRGLAGVFLSRTFPPAWLTLSTEEVDTLLKLYPQYNKASNKVPTEYRIDLARSIYAGFLTPVQHDKPSTYLSLDISDSLSRIDAAHMMYQRIKMAEQEQPVEERQIPHLPKGIKIVVSPTTAISAEQLFVGESLYFSTVRNLEIETLQVVIPRGTRLHTKVIEVDRRLANVQAKLVFDRAMLPSGDIYNLNAESQLLFQPSKNRPNVIVPGDQIEGVTTGQ